MNTIHVDVVSADESIYSGEARFEALPGEAGELGIYPRHTPLITRIKAGSGRIETADGGEEFVCLLSLEKEADAAMQLERLRNAIENFDLKIDGEHIPVTVSIGFTLKPGKSLADMIEMADQALYRAKQTGRNRVMRDEN